MPRCQTDAHFYAPARELRQGDMRLHCGSAAAKFVASCRFEDDDIDVVTQTCCSFDLYRSTLASHLLAGAEAAIE